MFISRAVLIAALAPALWGCARDVEKDSPSAGDSSKVRAAVAQGTGIDPARYTGEVTFKFPAELPTRSGPVPFVVYAGLSPATDTRLGVNAFADLRLAQIRLPELLSGVLVSECGQEFTLDLAGVEAEGDRVRAGGTVLAELFRCKHRDTPEEERGFRLLSQKVDVVAVATANVSDNCVEFSLVDLELDPRGFLGGLANLFGLTERARVTILEEGDAFLAENPICPDLPEELVKLDPKYSSGGPREIGEGGIGTALTGSVDTSAATLINLIVVLKKHGLVEGQR